MTVRCAALPRGRRRLRVLEACRPARRLLPLRRRSRARASFPGRRLPATVTPAIDSTHCAQVCLVSRVRSIAALESFRNARSAEVRKESSGYGSQPEVADGRGVIWVATSRRAGAGDWRVSRVATGWTPEAPSRTPRSAIDSSHIRRRFLTSTLWYTRLPPRRGPAWPLGCLRVLYPGPVGYP